MRAHETAELHDLELSESNQPRPKPGETENRAEGSGDDLLAGALAIILSAVVPIAVGVWWIFPWLKREHARLELWEAVLIWAADGTALLLACGAAVAAWISRRSARQASSIGTSRTGRVHGILLLTCWWTAFAVDLGISAYLGEREERLFQNAAMTVGQVQRLETCRRRNDRLFVLHCRFVDRAGAAHTAIHTTWTYGLNFLLHGRNVAPHPLKRELQKGQVPFPVRISYVRTSPQRSWLTDVASRDIRESRSLHNLSLRMVSMQGWSMAVMLWLVGPWRAESKTPAGTLDPVRYELLRFCPLLSLSFLFFVIVVEDLRDGNCWL